MIPVMPVSGGDLNAPSPSGNAVKETPVGEASFLSSYTAAGPVKQAKPVPQDDTGPEAEDLETDTGPDVDIAAVTDDVEVDVAAPEITEAALEAVEVSATQIAPAAAPISEEEPAQGDPEIPRVAPVAVDPPDAAEGMVEEDTVKVHPASVSGQVEEAGVRPESAALPVPAAVVSGRTDAPAGQRADRSAKGEPVVIARGEQLAAAVEAEGEAAPVVPEAEEAALPMRSGSVPRQAQGEVTASEAGPLAAVRPKAGVEVATAAAGREPEVEPRRAREAETITLVQASADGDPMQPLETVRFVAQSPAQWAVTFRAQAEGTISEANFRSLQDAEGEVDAPDQVVMNSRMSQSVSLRGAGAEFLARPDAGQAVAQQVAATVSARGTGQYDVALNPPELGRLRIRMEAADGTMAVTISADRQDTLDLMRRHVDQLQRTLEDLGYENLTFDFGQTGGGEFSGDTGTDAEDGGLVHRSSSGMADTVPLAERASVHGGQVDIRF